MSGSLDVFQRRLAKNQKRLPRMLPPKTDCYFVYDRDVPEFPFIVERWGPRARLVEMPGRQVRTDDDHQAFLEQARQITAQTLRLEDEDVLLRRRLRRRKGQAHSRLQRTDRRHVVQEAGRKYWVNLDDYVDTGLFLDHRKTRQMVAKLAPQKSLLNLFAYTGSFSVAAACAGAAAVTSVDLSQRYLSWADENFALNEVAGIEHRTLATDCVGYLERAAREGVTFDLIVLDPPTHSTSEKMVGDLDVQRDHAALVEGCLALLAPGGTLFFSTNLRSFALDASLRGKLDDITAHTVPPDCHHRPHQCFRARL